jgi:hypothetical protein
LINVLPNGHPGSEGAQLGENFQAATQTVSDDGSRAIWSSGNALYVRKNIGQPQSPIDGAGECEISTDACTLQVDASQGGLDSGGSGQFLTGTIDGSTVFFRDTRRLTPDATGGAEGDLYEFDVSTGQLADLTPSGGHVLGVLGTAANGSYVYFVADGVLAEGASPGNCSKGNPLGLCNLYLRQHNGTTTYIATLSGQDEDGAAVWRQGVALDWSRSLQNQTTRISTSGQHLVFMSARSLTGYDNTAANGTNCGIDPSNLRPLPAQCQEIYSYDATANEGNGELSCVSCNPSGARPRGGSGIPAGSPFDGFHAIYLSRVLSSNAGRVFFDSADALVPQDTNGTVDVYEWEAQGTGTCRTPSGCIGLISSGSSAANSAFVDASANGDDVFFITSSSLLPQDPGLFDLYDARVGGGFPAPPPGPAPCEGDACHSSGAPPGDPTLSTSVSSGSGNQAELFKRHHKKRQHKKGKRHHKRAVNHKRGGAK